MRVPNGWTLAAAVAAAMTLGGVASAQPAVVKDAPARPAATPLVGAWRLVWLDEPGPDGTMRRVSDAKGSLIYTADGHVSVQVMYATTAATSSNAPVQYAQNGYEASFGRYTVDTASRTVTHRYAGSLVRSLLGQDLPRRYEVAGSRLVIRSTRADERWSVTWERDVPAVR